MSKRRRVTVWLTDSVAVKATLLPGRPFMFWNRVQFDGPVDLPPAVKIVLDPEQPDEESRL